MAVNQIPFSVVPYFKAVKKSLDIDRDILENCSKDLRSGEKHCVVAPHSSTPGPHLIIFDSTVNVRCWGRGGATVP
jgi:hypothetical protein